MECTTCKNEHRIKSLEEDRERNSSQHKEFYDSFKESEIENAVSKTNTNTILQAIYELKSDVKEIKDQPASNWKTFIFIVLTAAITYLVNLL